MAPILVTGAAGFIGYHLTTRLLDQGKAVVGIDNLDPYYSVQLKEDRLAQLRTHPNFTFERIDIAEEAPLRSLFERHRFTRVVNLAAQAGVRYSLENPQAYTRANLVGFVNILECCRHFGVEHLVYASSSSVYGAVTQMPFSVHQNVDHPLSVYAASKKANELLAHSYSHLFRLPATGVRFFTVYGPWGRPDMAMFLFTRAILAGEPIKVFNHGKMQRDFTYVDDVAEALTRLIDHIATPDPNWDSANPTPETSSAPHRLYNIGNHSPVALMRVVELLEQNLGREAIKDYLPMQPGDVPATFADIDALQREIGFTPATPIETGLAGFVAWYRDYFKV